MSEKVPYIEIGETSYIQGVVRIAIRFNYPDGESEDTTLNYPDHIEPDAITENLKVVWKEKWDSRKKRKAAKVSLSNSHASLRGLKIHVLTGFEEEMPSKSS